MATVVVAMSGGVDSSVAAYLLKKAGHRIIGITMFLWDKNTAITEVSQCTDSPVEFNTATVDKCPQAKDLIVPRISKTDISIDEVPEGLCCSWKAVQDARKVADRLGFPHYTVDLRNPFQSLVIQNFVEEYLQGRTPNPCIVCNRHIKFGRLLEQARALGADFVATGHYARVEKDPRRDRFLLLRGMDPKKDQSYFLYNLTQEQLRYVLFPLGSYHKKNIREIASELELVVADKPESQEICFVENNNYRDFLSQRVAAKIKPGPFLDIRGKELGRHQGLPYYTVGQRKGLGLAFGRPMYVVRIDAEKNAVVLGELEELNSRRVWTENNNFFPFDKLKDSMTVAAKVRYTAKPAEATIFPLSENQILVEFADPQRAVTPGQAIVYYQGDLVVGGGTIVRSE